MMPTASRRVSFLLAQGGLERRLLSIKHKSAYKSNESASLLPWLSRAASSAKPPCGSESSSSLNRKGKRRRKRSTFGRNTDSQLLKSRGNNVVEENEQQVDGRFRPTSSSVRATPGFVHGERLTDGEDILVQTVVGKPDPKLFDASKQVLNMAAPNIMLVTLGTGSMMPTKTRGVSSSALMFSGWTWLFDCGEETQSQIHKGSSVRLAGVTRIYITHLHGDHFFGLPSILCAISEVKAPSDAQKLKLSREKDKDVPIEIFGPPNLRLALRTMLLASGVVLPFRYVVTELHPKGAKTPSPASDLVNGVLHPSEILGKNLTSNDNFVWESVPTHCTPHPKDVSAVATVKAAMIRHSCNVTCIGYVVEEKSYSGSLDGQRAKEILRQPENQEYLIGIGVREPLRSLRYLKGGFELKLPTGILRPSDVVGPDKPGRKIVILGDTCDASNIAGIAANADMILHEATNAYLPELGLNGLLDSVDEWQTILRTLQHGHSTPQMAGKFAQAIGAKSLVMTHFSSRYPGMIPDRLKVTREMVEVYDAIRNAALETFKSGDAYLANDQEVFSVLGCWHESRVKDPTKVIKSSYRGFLRTARKIFASTDEQIVDFTLQPQGYRPSCKDMRNAYSCASKVMPPSFVSTEKFPNGPHYSEEFEMDEDEEDDEEMEDLEDNNQESEGDIADMAATSEKDASAPRDFDDGDLDDGDLDDDIGDDIEAGGGGSEHTEDASDLDKTSDLFQDGSCEDRPLSRSEASAAAKEAVKPYEKVLRRKRLFGARIIYPNSKAT